MLAGESAHISLQSRAGGERGKRPAEGRAKAGRCKGTRWSQRRYHCNTASQDRLCCEPLLGPAPGRASRHNARGGQGERRQMGLNFFTCSEEIQVRHWHRSRGTEQKRLILTKTFNDQNKLFRMSPCGTDSPLVAETQLRCVSVPLHFFYCTFDRSQLSF